MQNTYHSFLELITLSFVSLQDSSISILNDEEKQQTLYSRNWNQNWIIIFFMQKDWNNESIIKTVGN